MTIKITNLEYRKRFGISDRTALLDLTVICEKGIFQKVGVTGRETKYILTRHKTDRSINKYDMSAVNPTYKEDKRGQKDIAE
jgi:hypothetical protein